MERGPIVAVIDPDAHTRELIESLLKSVGLEVEVYGSANDFLEAVDPARPSCLVIETRLPGMSGLKLQQRLGARGVCPPIVFVTGHGDIAMAAEALRAGAVDFLEKPFRQQHLLDRVHEALERDAAVRRARTERSQLQGRIATLTARERQIMSHVAAGYPNRAIAGQLGVTRKAVEAYRARVMRKMRAASLAELVRMNVILEVEGDRQPGPRLWRPEVRRR